jgi:beta-galactosidase
MPVSKRCPVATLVLFFVPLFCSLLQAQTPATVTFDLSAEENPTPPRIFPQFGGKSPQGHEIGVNSEFLTLDGKPWLPVMGEFHYTRYPEQYWEEEILKMKAGGIQVIATYVFWIHHEEVEGQFDWTGHRDLRKFVELCAKHGMYVYPRIGPWAHGEVRNGGFPDWLLIKGPTRVNAPAYLSYVDRYYNEVAKQLKGLLWKDGGPIIGIQLENEYSDRSPNGGAAYISKLKSMAIADGLVVPLYTVTGWDNAVYPPEEVLPIFGAYPEEFWSGSREELAPDPEHAYQFQLMPTTGTTGIMQGTTAKSDTSAHWPYPRFTAELGGGMQVAYHRRPVMSEDDIEPMAITQLGSGVNLLGYYMYHGGTNPQGKLTSLQESQVTNYPNDLPVKTYDFQAPLREFGQMNGSFRKLKVIHQFLADFGGYLAPMKTVVPDLVPLSPQDTTTLRIVARTNGDHGFIFVNNYVRHYPLPEHKDVQVVLKFPSEVISLPHSPVTIPAQSSFFWPVNMDLNGVLLKYATAEPFAKIKDGKITYYFFTACSGIAPEFAFSQKTVAALSPHAGGSAAEGERLTYVNGMKPSTDVAMDIKTHSGDTIRIVLLSPEQAEDSWKIAMGGRENLLITPADVFFDGESISLRSRDANAFSFSIFPATGGAFASTVPVKKVGDDGVFDHYTAPVAAKQLQVNVEKVRDAQPSSPAKMGKPAEWRHGAVAQAPDDAGFEKAGVWRLTFPKDTLQGLSDVFLDINYAGDVGRAYEGRNLLDDNFYNGTTWEIGLKRFAPDILAKGMEVKILPLRKDAPIYIPKSGWPDFDGNSEVSNLNSAVLSPEYELKLTMGNGSPPAH